MRGIHDGTSYGRIQESGRISDRGWAALNLVTSSDMYVWASMMASVSDLAGFDFAASGMFSAGRLSRPVRIGRVGVAWCGAEVINPGGTW